MLEYKLVMGLPEDAAANLERNRKNKSKEETKREQCKINNQHLYLKKETEYLTPNYH